MNRNTRVLLTVAAVALTSLCWVGTQTRTPGALAFFDRWSLPVFVLDAVLTGAVFWGLRALWSDRPRRVVFECVAVSFPVVLVLVMAELPALLFGLDYSEVLGTGGAERFTHVHASDNPSNLKDAELGFRHQPHTGFEGPVAGDLVKLLGIATQRKYDVDIAYDDDGFRNAAPMPEAEIVLIGDSFVEAALVPSEQTVAARLERALDAPVLNLGVSGYGPEQERRVLVRYGLPKQPRWVFWFFFEGNDLIDTGRFDFRQAQRASDAVPKRAFRDRAFSVNLLYWLAALTQPALQSDAEPARTRHCRYERAVDPGLRDVYFAFDGQQGEHIEQFDKVKAEIQAARDQTEAAGARFVVLYVPVKLRVLGAFCAFEAGSLVEGWRPDDFPTRMAAFAAQAGLEFVDLTPALVRSAEAGRSPYYPDDGHWNAVAHAVVAHAILDLIDAEPLPRKSDHPVAPR